jgi:hypothetical protein
MKKRTTLINTAYPLVCYTVGKEIGRKAFIAFKYRLYLNFEAFQKVTRHSESFVVN